ncbi:MAG: hypothetical protein GF398_00045 [Chitinivibrionales bacterium]|nr:hypothetical protein [Chitinivibrionales bacterium]
MRFKRLIFCVLLFFVGIEAMDGVAVVFIRYGKYNTTWKMVRYTIQNDRVVDRDTLYTLKHFGDPNNGWTAYQPDQLSINMSGTHVAFPLDDPDTKQRYIGIMRIDGTGRLMKIPTKGRAKQLFWIEDGTILYYALNSSDISNVFMDDYWIRRLKLMNDYGKVNFLDTAACKMSYSAAANTFGISRDGKKYVTDMVGPPYGCENQDSGAPAHCLVNGSRTSGALITGDTSRTAPIAFRYGNCGSAISPSGDYWHRHPGDHDKNTFHTWENALAYDTAKSRPEWQNVDPDCGTFQHDLYNLEWAVDDPNDPLRNLEAKFRGGDWVSYAVGCNSGTICWAANSDKWFCPILQWRPNVGAGNFTAINWKNKKAFNVTKIPPQKSTYKHPAGFTMAEFRGIDIPQNGADTIYALRGDMWCSTRDDVVDKFWKYVENRDTYAQELDNFLHMDAAAKSNIMFEEMATASGGPGASRTLQRGMPVGIRYSRKLVHVTVPDNAQRSFLLADISGKIFYRGSSSKSKISFGTNLIRGRHAILVVGAGTNKIARRLAPVY